MNMKVVLVWGFAVVVFFAIGIFGYLNQDVLVDDSMMQDNNQKPEVQYTTKICSATNDNGDISYTFRINPSTNTIERVFVKYEGRVENIDVYAAASNINQVINANQVKGVNSQLYGTSKDVTLNLNINLQEYDSNYITNLKSDLTNVGMVVDNIPNYDTYVNTMSNTFNISFTCD